MSEKIFNFEITDYISKTCEQHEMIRETYWKGYEDGLEDMWQYVYNIICIPMETCEEIFGENNLYLSEIICNMSASEVVDCLNKFRKEQAKKCITCIHKNKDWHDEPCNACCKHDSYYQTNQPSKKIISNRTIEYVTETNWEKKDANKEE